MRQAKSKPSEVSTTEPTMAAVQSRTRASARSQSELVHELEVHQIELEMQNEELRHAQIDLAEARDRYVDLYDFAPVGYFTLDAHGVVTAANLTGAKMLGAVRSSMVGHGLSRFVLPSQVDCWHRHVRQTLRGDLPGRIELELRKASGETFHAQLDSTSTRSETAPPVLWVALTDITIRKLAETDRRIADTVHDARESERGQVARQLHEGLGQLLSALKMELGGLSQPMGQDLQNERIHAMVATVDIALESVRRITADLRPPMLDDLGLVAAIEWLANDASRHRGLDVRLDLHALQSAPDERTSTAVYRMAQDVVDSFARYDHVASITLYVSQQGRDLAFGARYRCKPGSDGVNQMAYKNLVGGLMDRAHLLGGQVDYATRVGRQPQIMVRLPLSREDDQ